MTGADISIVGMSCRFAGCPTVAAFWEAICARRVLLTTPSADAELPIGQSNVFGKPYPTRLGQLGDLYACVPSAQNFPRQVNAGENQDLYFATQLVLDALADAAMPARPAEGVRGTVRVGYAPPFNASTVNWLQHTSFLDQTMDILRRFFPNAPEDALSRIRSDLVESLPSPDAASFLMGAGYRFASWIARECAFQGAATIMDGGILSGASTLAAAMDDLRARRADVALAGALNPPLSRAYIEGLSGAVPFSTRSELHPFEQEQHGTIPGEGGAFLVLKRREDALRDRDRIYANVRSVAIGRVSADDPARLVREAADEAETPISSIGLVEADGTGIPRQEQREVEILKTLWGHHRPGGSLVGVGSVKGNIGHTLRAAMSAGVVKAALALHHKVLPPQVAPDHPVDDLSNLSSSAYILTETRPWITAESALLRRASVWGANFDSCSPTVDEAHAAGRAAVVMLEEEPEDRS